MAETKIQLFEEDATFEKDDFISRRAAIRLASGGCHPANVAKELAKLPHAQQWTFWESGELPKESGWYIVTAYDGRTLRTTFAKYQKRLKRWDLTGARAYWRVLAWMPLPKPYMVKDGKQE